MLYRDRYKKVPQGSEIRPGQSLFAPLTVYNLGGKREDMQIDVFLRNTATNKEVRLKRVNLGFLYRGQHKESMQHFNVPNRSSNFPYGSYQLGWRVDPRNLIPTPINSFQKTNNVSLAEEIYQFR